MRVREPLRAALERDAAVEGVSRRWAWTLFLAPWIGAVLVAVSFLDRPLFYWIVDEDHVLEWSQFFFDVGTAVVAALCVRPFWRRDHRLMAVLLLGLAVFSFFVAGEEISWGQRIFGFATPVDLATVNNQDEFNLHNITKGFSVQKAFNYVQIAAALLGGVLPWLTRVRPPRVTSQTWRYVSPALFLTSSFLIIGVYRIVRLAIPSSESISPAVKFGEWPELCLAFGLFAYVFLLHRSIRREGSGQLVQPFDVMGDTNRGPRHAVPRRGARHS